jgi:putative hydrolase of the HAD superfamily
VLPAIRRRTTENRPPALLSEMLTAIIFDLGHTIVDELGHRAIPVRSRPAKLMPGVKDTLPKISLRMGIWANTRRAKEPGVRRWLRRAGIDRHFTWLVTSAEAGYRKPDKRFFAYALQRCGLETDEVLFVGNQLNTDIRGAADYGIKSVWLSGPEFKSPDDNYIAGQVEPTYSVRRLEELPGLIQKLQR